MIDRGEFLELKDEVQDLQLKLVKGVGREPTLGDMMEDGSLAGGLIRVWSDSEYIKTEVRHRLTSWLGDPEEYFDSSKNRMLHISVPINSMGTEDDRRDLGSPAFVGTYAAKHYGTKAAKNRIASLREVAQLCEQLADAFEDRRQQENAIRRLK